MSNRNVLIFSNACDASKQLIVLLQNENLIKYFYLHCIDTQGVPQGITVTPTIIIGNIPTPFVANDAFVWFSKIKQWKLNMMMQRVSNAQQQYLQTINKNLITDNNLLGFSRAEMEGMSDLFSYIKEDSALPQSYFTYGNLGQENIFTPPVEQNKLDSNRQKDLFNKLKSDRKKQDDMFRENINNFVKSYDK